MAVLCKLPETLHIYQDTFLTRGQWQPSVGENTPLETLAAQSSWRQNNHFPEVGSCFVMTILNDTQTQSQVWSAPLACLRDQGIIVGFWIDMKFSRNQSQKPECLRAVPDRCSAYQSLNHREIVILHRNYIQKQNRAKSLPTTHTCIIKFLFCSSPTFFLMSLIKIFTRQY